MYENEGEKMTSKSKPSLAPRQNLICDAHPMQGVSLCVFSINHSFFILRCESGYLHLFSWFQQGEKKQCIEIANKFQRYEESQDYVVHTLLLSQLAFSRRPRIRFGHHRPGRTWLIN
jgi:hypothetical protein